MVLSVVVLLAVVLLLPTVRAYVNQTGELRQLRAELATNEARRDELDVELARWDDRSYVVEQARSRLAFVMPGDRVWRTLDAESVVEDVDPATGRPVEDGPVVTEPEVPWYQAIWESVQVAGTHGATDVPTDGSTPAPSGTTTEDAGEGATP